MSYAIVMSMARRRTDERQLSDAFREAYEAAGVSQVQIAEECEVDQPTVSKWARGVLQPPLWALPIIDELCGRPKGHVLRLAGYVEDDFDVEAALAVDPSFADPDDRAMVVRFYKRMRDAEPLGSAGS